MNERSQTALRTASASQLPARSWRGLRRVLFASALVAAAYGGMRWLVAQRPTDQASALVARRDIISSTRVTGRIVPREEVFVRSLVAGLLDELKVLPGAQVKRGDHIATVRVVADPVMLSEARAQVTRAEDKLQRAQRELERVRPKDKTLSVSGRDIALAEDELRLANVELQYARERLRLVAQGTAAERGTRSTRVMAPIDGTVLAAPVAVGDVISDTNSYRDGTTLAVIADMGQLLFKGQVEEAYVGKLQLGMPVEVRIGALEGSSIPGKLSWIAPRASIELTGATPGASIAPLSSSSAGVTRFELWVELASTLAGVRAGYSAAAEFTLDSRKSVISVEERALRFERGQAFARVLGVDGGSSERLVRVGLSDGVTIEVLDGLLPGDRVTYADAPPPL